MDWAGEAVLWASALGCLVGGCLVGKQWAAVSSAPGTEWAGLSLLSRKTRMGLISM